MSKPDTPIRAIALAQQALLQQIDGGDDWHTTIGRAVYLAPIRDDDAPLHVALSEIQIDPIDRDSAIVLCTWAAIVPDDDTADLSELYVLADLRHALTCNQPRIRIQQTDIARREPGSHYAVVSVTTAVHQPTR